MQKIELLYGGFLGVQILEGGLVSLDLDKRSLEGGFDVVIGGDSSQCFGVFGNSKHHSVGFEEFYVNWQPFLLPFVGPQVEDLLRSTGAFDRHCRFGEDSLA